MVQKHDEKVNNNNIRLVAISSASDALFNLNEYLAGIRSKTNNANDLIIWSMSAIKG